jgi:hypothetical protein
MPYTHKKKKKKKKTIYSTVREECIQGFGGNVRRDATRKI